MAAKQLRPYSDAFFDGIDEGSSRSAEVIVPLVCELVRPRSVVDVGCGRGVWLRAFSQNGVESILGLDGDYVSSEKLAIPDECFRAQNLAHRIRLDRRFDLAVNLEVAEHLPESRAAGLVEELTHLASIVLFSAAIPGQTGTDHINEQWPWYWQALFSERGFRLLDPIRPRIRHDKRVKWWYRQNLLIYASDEAIANTPALQPHITSEPLEWVHVSLVQHSKTVRALGRELPKALASAARRRLVRRGK